MHPDHTLGNGAFAAEGAKFAGHAKLPQALAARWESFTRRVTQELGSDPVEGLAPAVYDVLVGDELTLDLGNRRITLKAWPTAHTDNDLTVYDEATGTIFMGDLLFNKHLPAIDGSIKGWLALFERFATIPAKRAVPGHGLASVEWPGALAAEQRYFETLASDLRRAIKDGKHIGDAAALSAQGERSNWDLFDDFHPRNATAAFEELEWE
jgi:quinoprotein relay system zinc metallohydrolase 2